MGRKEGALFTFRFRPRPISSSSADSSPSQTLGQIFLSSSFSRVGHPPWSQAFVSRRKWKGGGGGRLTDSLIANCPHPTRRPKRSPFTSSIRPKSTSFLPLLPLRSGQNAGEEISFLLSCKIFRSQLCPQSCKSNIFRTNGRNPHPQSRGETSRGYLTSLRRKKARPSETLTHSPKNRRQ